MKAWVLILLGKHKVKKFRNKGTYLNSVVSLVVGTTPLLCLCSSTLMPPQPASKYHHNTYRLLLINQIPKCQILRYCLNNSQCCFKANEHLYKIKVLTSALMKTHIFWDNTPCQSPNNYWPLRALLDCSVPEGGHSNIYVKFSNYWLMKRSSYPTKLHSSTEHLIIT